MTLAARITLLAEAIRDKINLMVPRLVPSGGTTGQVLSKSSATDYAMSWVAAGGGSAKPSGTVVVTVPNNSLDWQETVAAAGVVVGDKVLLGFAACTSADENEPETLDVAGMAAESAADGFLTINLNFHVPTNGAIRLIFGVV